MDSIRLAQRPGGKQLERLLSEREAIEVLGLGERPNPQSALRWLMRTRKLAYVRLARGIYGFRREDLAAFIDAGWVQAGVLATKKNDVDT
ncbi:MAG TPA: hypothetical protein VM431_06655 [Phycisphaerae bacterium]|nr:hypothetical protein [Phycisphaerae bacterium]